MIQSERPDLSINSRDLPDTAHAFRTVGEGGVVQHMHGAFFGTEVRCAAIAAITARKQFNSGKAACISRSGVPRNRMEKGR
jgi:hypothetical protein